MRPGEFPKLARRCPATRKIEPLDGSSHPHVHGKRLVKTASEQERAVGDLFTHAWNLLQLFQCPFILPAGKVEQPNLTGINHPRRRLQILRAEPQLAPQQYRQLRARHRLHIRKSSPLPQSLRHQLHDLTDLRNLLRRAGDERCQRLPRFLPKDAQPPMLLHRQAKRPVLRERRHDRTQIQVE